MKPLLLVNALSVPCAGAFVALSVIGSPSASLQLTESSIGLPVRIVMSGSPRKHTGAELVTVTVTVAGADCVTESWAR